MAPWGSRLIPTNSPETLNPANTSTRSISPHRPLGPSQVTESDILQHAYSIPTLQASPDRVLSQAPPVGERSFRHGRSRSHPFPSLFQSKKKQQGEHNTAGFDLTDEENSATGSSPSVSKTDNGKRTRVPDKDLTTGRCMTCDSMVRWPKELYVFRCTVCLTINDLKPIGQPTTNASGRRQYGSTQGTATPHHPPMNQSM